MITHLEIKGFKSLVDVSIELGAVNVFIGANGSGKSNLLEAVGFLSAIVQSGLEAESIRYRGVREGSPASFRTSLRGTDQQPISISTVKDKIRYSAEFEPDPLHPSQWSITKESSEIGGWNFFVRAYDRFRISLPSGARHESGIEPSSRNVTFMKPAIVAFSILKELVIPGFFKPKDAPAIGIPDLEPTLLEDISQFAIFTPSTPQLRGSYTDIQREPLGLGGSSLGQAIDDMLKGEPDKLGPFDLEDVYELIDWADSLKTDPETSAGQDDSGNGRPIRLRIGDRFMNGSHRSVSLVEASEGALYVLFMLALVGHERSPKFFAVDNFDQALHPRLARALTRLVSEQIVDDGSRQMLATTHNPLVLDGLDILDDRIRLFTVDRDPTGASQVRRVLVTEELMARSDEGFSLSQLWTTGRLGGVPRAI